MGVIIPCVKGQLETPILPIGKSIFVDSGFSSNNYAKYPKLLFCVIFATNSYFPQAKMWIELWSRQNATFPLLRFVATSISVMANKIGTGPHRSDICEELDSIICRGFEFRVSTIMIVATMYVSYHKG